MTPETMFLICNNGVLPAWLLLALAPHWRGTQVIVHAIWIPGLLGLAYLWAMLSGGPPVADGGFGSLAGVMALLSTPHAALAGWIHYLAFDLFVGAWESRDARRLGISPWLVLPCLFLTLMAGPVGLLLYGVLRLSLRKTATLQEA